MDATGSINLHTFRKPNVIFPNRKIHGGWNFVFASTLIQKANGCKFSVLMRLKVCRLFCGFCGMKTHALGISHSKKYQTCMRPNSNSKCAFYVLFQMFKQFFPGKTWTYHDAGYLYTKLEVPTENLIDSRNTATDLLSSVTVQIKVLKHSCFTIYLASVHPKLKSLDIYS